uniref:Uncharacterized protein n=1 Tax=Fagus sylvatica TaxID=28930 RepID=A0A2N9H886_FAGSY
MDSIFPSTFNNPDPSTFALDVINLDPMTFSRDDSFWHGNIDLPPSDLPNDLELDNLIVDDFELDNLMANWLASDLENPPTKARMIAADSVVTGVVWTGESSSSKQDKFAVAVNQADGGTLGSSRDNSDKSDDNEIEGEIMEITEDMVPA